MFAASAERGNLRPTRHGFLDEIQRGSLYVGSPETVATKLADTIRLLGINRFDLAYAFPGRRRAGSVRMRSGDHALGKLEQVAPGIPEERQPGTDVVHVKRIAA
jgi:hypothetical protein